MTDSCMRRIYVSKRPHARRAFTLLEMVATLATLFVVAVAAASMLGSITDIGIRYRHSLEERTAVRRFAEAFRRDISESIEVLSADNQWPLELKCREQLVEYRWDPASTRLMRLVRRDSSGGASGEIIATDVYSLTDRCQPEIVVSQDHVSVILRRRDAEPNWMVEGWR